MPSHLLLLTTVLLSFIFIYLTHVLYFRLKKFDRITSRSSHTSLATRSGGAGVFLCLATIILYFYLNSNQIFDFSLLIPLGIVFFTGAYDDMYEANFKIKFFLQIIGAKILIDQGHVIENFHGIFGIECLSRIPSQLFTIFVFLVVTNAINLIDGIDGLAISIMGYIIIAYLLLSQNSELILFCSLLGAALLPLYYFNFKKQNKVFLGDGGSLLLGAITSILMIDLLEDQNPLNFKLQINKAYLTILILAYPLIDLLRVFILRVRYKKSPFQADANHLHHTILRKVNAHAPTTLILLGLSVIFLVLHLVLACLLNDVILVVLDCVFILWVVLFKTRVDPQNKD